MTDAPTPQRAASAEERDRRQETPETAAFAAALFQLANVVRFHVTVTPAAVINAMSNVIETLQPIAAERSDLLDRITAAEARAEEAERERDDARCVGEALARAADANLEAVEAATADRDRLADEVARLKARTPD